MTVLDKYFELSDIAGNDSNSFDNLVELFSDNAKISAADGSIVEGKENIKIFFKNFFDRNKLLKHVWNTKVIDDQNIETDWAVAGKRNNDTVFSFTGKDKAMIDEGNRIVELTVIFN